jgi:adenylate cyclase
MSKDSLINILERGFYGIIVGLIYAGINFNWSMQLFIACALIGFSIGFFTALLDRWLSDTRLRRQQFFIVLIVRTVSYLAVISISLVLVLGIYTTLVNSSDISHLLSVFSDWIKGGTFAYTVFYSLVVLLVLQLLTLVSRLLGPNVLLNYMMGRYHQPKEEERIFMFLDLRGSTTIAERLGHFRWHRFLNDFFFDIARTVRNTKGEIYQYVGDEVVISWPKEVGIQKLNCIHCFFWIYDRMENPRTRDRYLKKYGYRPVFKAGYHVGKVVVGEIGDYKREIVFHGDTVNTASRIQVECNHYNRRLLLSKTLLDLLDLRGEYTTEYITKILLRGKGEEIELYSLDPV